MLKLILGGLAGVLLTIGGGYAAIFISYLRKGSPIG